MKIWEVRTNGELDPSLLFYISETGLHHKADHHSSHTCKKYFSVESANTAKINMVGGVHIRMAPTVPTGILSGRDVLGHFIRNHINAMNSKIIPKQYKKFSAATIS